MHFSTSSPKSAFGRYVECATIAGLAALIGWFYLWTVNPEGDRTVLSHQGPGYYNLLTGGFLKGQTALNLAVDPAVLKLKDPYDPAERSGLGLHDASYYKGRYFIYFGASPAVVSFLPVKLLTGEFLEERFAILAYAIGGFLLSVATLLSIRRYCFPAAPTWIVLAGVLTLGLATMVAPLLRRPSIWEVPIAAAYTGFMLTLFCMWRAVRTTRGGWLWLALGSLAMGVTVGARPTYLLGAVVLLVPLALRLTEWRSRDWRGLVAATFGPIIVVGIALAAYNFARFGSVAEFGQTYQMAGDDIRGLKLFSPGYIPYNFRIYVLAAAGLSPFFPFITVIDAPPPPPGQFGIEDPYGLLPCLPWVVLVVAALLPALPGEISRRLRGWATGTAVAALLTMVLVFCFGGTCGRYMVDFTPALILLAGVGAMALGARARGVWRFGVGGVVAILAIWSAGFGLLASLQHNALMQAEYPAVYRRVAVRANWPGALLDRWTGREYGPVEMEVVFPKDRVGKVEPLVVTGRTFRADYLYVHYLTADTVRFGYEHTSYGGKTGAAVRIKPGERHKLRVDMGSLYPPAAHPYFVGMNDVQARLRQKTIRVSLDGVEVLKASADLYDAVAHRPDIGSSRNRPGFREPFSGEIVSWRIAPEAAPTPSSERYGPLVITLTLPPFTGVRCEPLVSSGVNGKGNLVYLRYLDAQTVAVGFDHWGAPGFESDPVKVVPGKRIEVQVDYGALHDPVTKPEARLLVMFDGVTVIDRAAPSHVAAPESVVVGTNPIGASTAIATFTGEINGKYRLTPGSEKYGALLITLTPPLFTGTRCEPLVCSGETGRGDLVYIRYVDAKTVTVGYDHWGEGGFESKPVKIEPGKQIELMVDYGALHAPYSVGHQRVVVRLDNATLLDQPGKFYACAPETVVVGANPIGASTAITVFTGEIVDKYRLRR